MQRHSPGADLEGVLPGTGTLPPLMQRFGLPVGKDPMTIVIAKDGVTVHEHTEQ